MQFTLLKENLCEKGYTLFLSMSGKTITESQSIERFVVEAHLLGLEKTMCKRRRKVSFERANTITSTEYILLLPITVLEQEFALEVTLSDESKFTVYRTIKDIAKFHSKLVRTFPVEAGHFSQTEKVIPDCPVHRTPFGVRRIIKNDRAFEQLLNFYVKELPALPASIIKSGFIDAFFKLRASDFQLPEGSTAKKDRNNTDSKTQPNSVGEISSPMTLPTYVAVADFVSPDGVVPAFSFKKGSLLQVIQKDQSGWWMVDSQGITGWAPASFLFPLDEEEFRKAWEDNQHLIGAGRVGTRYIATSAYEAVRDDELSFVQGAVVKLIRKQINGWWLVHYNGQEGLVPGSFLRKFDRRQASIYVKKIKRGYVSRRSMRVAPTMCPKWMKEQGNPSDIENHKTLSLYQCVKQFSGSPNSAEISLYQGESVKVLNKKTSGWWYVEDEYGRTGWVPASHLKLILDQSPKQRCLSEDLIPLNSLIDSLQIAIRPHVAQKEDELSINEGEVVTVVEVSEDGWWTVRSLINEEGLVPSLCLTQEIYEDSSRQTHLPRVHSIADVFNNRINDDNGKELGAEECCYHVVTRDYRRQAQDELNVFEGEVARIIDSTHGDVCYANVNGAEGWLPTDLLSPLARDLDTPLPSSLLVVAMESDDTEKDTAENTQVFYPPIPPRPTFPTHSRTHPFSSPALKLRRFKSCSSSSSSSSAWSWDKNESISSFGSILIESQSLEEVEQAAAEAERLAMELRRRAEDLKSSS